MFGPGGLGGGFIGGSLPVPLQIPDLGTWIDFSDVATRTDVSTDIDAISDKSGNGCGFTAQASGQRPAIATAQQNGLDGADFAKADSDYMNIDASCLDLFRNIPGWTVFVVTDNINSGGGTSVFAAQSGGQAKTVINRHVTGHILSGIRRLSANGSSMAGVSTEFGTAPIVITQHVDFSVPRHAVRRDGAEEGTVDTITTGGNSEDIDANHIRIGTNVASAFYGGYVYEILVYKRALTTTEIQQVETYLGDKWGVTIAHLPIMHLYAEGDSLTSPGVWLGKVVADVDYSGYDLEWRNFGVFGETIEDMQADTAEIKNIKVGASDKEILMLLAGTNNSGGVASVAEGLLDDLASEFQADGMQVVAGTLPARTTNMSFVDAFNVLVRANASGYSDGVADVGADPLFDEEADALDATYYTDGIHMTTAGYTQVGVVFTTAVNLLP